MNQAITKGAEIAITKIFESFANGVIDLNTSVEQMFDEIEKINEGVYIDAENREFERPAPDDIIRIVSKMFGVPVEDVISTSRKRDFVEPRQFAMALCRAFCNPALWSLKKIGNKFSGRDHSTVIYAIETVEDLKATNKTFKVVYDSLLKKIEKLYNVKPILKHKFENAESLTA